MESAHERPPASADLRTLPAGISTGGATATTVAASNQIFLYVIQKELTVNSWSPEYLCKMSACNKTKHICSPK